MCLNVSVISSAFVFFLVFVCVTDVLQPPTAEPPRLVLLKLHSVSVCFRDAWSCACGFTNVKFTLKNLRATSWRNFGFSLFSHSGRERRFVVAMEQALRLAANFPVYFMLCFPVGRY